MTTDYHIQKDLRTSLTPSNSTASPTSSPVQTISTISSAVDFKLDKLETDQLNFNDLSTLTTQKIHQLYDKWQGKTTPLPVPIVMSRKIDLMKMMLSVLSKGGYEKTTSENTWKYVFLDCTGAPSFSSNTGYYTRIAYDKYLRTFEKKHFPPSNPKFTVNLSKYYSGNNMTSNTTRLSSPSNSQPPSPSSRARQGSAKDDDDGSQADMDELTGSRTSRTTRNGRPRKRGRVSRNDYVRDRDAMDEDLPVENKKDWDEADEEQFKLELLSEGKWDIDILEGAPSGPPFANDNARKAWFEFCEKQLKELRIQYLDLQNKLSDVDQILSQKDLKRSVRISTIGKTIDEDNVMEDGNMSDDAHESATFSHDSNLKKKDGNETESNSDSDEPIAIGRRRTSRK